MLEYMMHVSYDIIINLSLFSHLPHYSYGFFMSETVLIRALLGERLIDIAAGNETFLMGELLTAEFERISISIQLLMMM